MNEKHHYFWAFVERVAPMAISFAVSVAIARKVEPSAYGLIGMMAIFMALGQAFTELGFGAALVQRKETTANDETSVFVVNICMGLVITSGIWLISPWVASFFEQQDLVGLLRGQSLGILVASTALVQFSLISKAMKFRLGAIVELLATVISGAVGLSMAYLGYGVWSLIGLSLTRETVRAGTVWMISDWRPRGSFSMVSVKSMWSYCSKLLYSSIFHRVTTNAYSVIMGKIFPPAALGLYARANSLQALPVGIVTGIVQRVAFPLFSKHQSDKPALIQLIRKQIRFQAFFVSSMMAGIFVLAADFVPWLLGVNWNESVPLLRILCFAGVGASLFPMHSQMTMARGMSDLFFKIEVAKKIFIVLALLAAYQHGVKAFAWAAVAVSLSDYILSAYPSARHLGYTWLMQMKDIVPALCLSLISGIVVSFLSLPDMGSAVVTMVIKSVGIIVIIGSGLFVFRRMFFTDIWAMISGGVMSARSRMKSA